MAVDIYHRKMWRKLNANYIYEEKRWREINAEQGTTRKSCN
jgi:hypothetical protein